MFTIVFLHDVCVCDFQTDRVRWWWPNGFGSQQLYKVFFTFLSRRGELSTHVRRIGFRTVDLVQKTVSSATPGQGNLNRHVTLTDM